MDAWTQALIDYGILLLGSTLVTSAWIIGKGEPNTPLQVLGASVTNGAVGAGLGVCVVERWGVRAAIAIGSLIGAGIVERATIIKWVGLAIRWAFQKVGIHDDSA